MKKQEDFKNRALSMLLKELGVDCDYEQRIGRKRLDIVANVEGLRVVLEAETGYHKRAQAIKDADARLRQKLTIAAIALCYPENVTEENMGESPLRWTLRTKAGEPAAQWSTGSVAQLAQTLRQVPNVLDDADVAARLLSDGLDSVVQRLKTPTRRALARAWTCQPPNPKVDTTPTVGSWPPSGECLWLQRPCSSTIGCRTTYPANVRTTTQAPGLPPTQRPALTAMHPFRLSAKPGVASLPWTIGPCSRRAAPPWRPSPPTLIRPWR